MNYTNDPVRTAESEDWLQSLDINSVYQPVVELADRTVVGYEALARGREGTELESPDALFREARRRGLVGGLDWLCRASAVDGALDAELPASLHLFVNLEPTAIETQHIPGVIERAADLSVIIEITERDLLVNPAALLRAIAGIRKRGWRIAVDDVGADSASLALLPFIRPDVIKLDMRLVQERTTEETAQIIGAVSAESGRTGGVILAEGIETEQHAALAQEMGAKLAQGWLFGRPAQLPHFGTHQIAHSYNILPKPLTAQNSVGATPYGLAHEVGGVRTGTTELISTMIEQLELQARHMAGSTVVLATIPRSRAMPAEDADRFGRLADTCAIVVVFGNGVYNWQTKRTRLVEVAPEDPLAREGTAIVISPQFTGALFSQDLGDDGPWSERRFDYRLTHDRNIVLAAAATLMHRVPALDVGLPVS